MTPSLLFWIPRRYTAFSPSPDQAITLASRSRSRKVRRPFGHEFLSGDRRIQALRNSIWSGACGVLNEFGQADADARALRQYPENSLRSAEITRKPRIPLDRLARKAPAGRPCEKQNGRRVLDVEISRARRRERTRLRLLFDVAPWKHAPRRDSISLGLPMRASVSGKSRIHRSGRFAGPAFH